MDNQKMKILTDVDNALKIVENNLANMPEDNLMQSILAQLKFIKKDLSCGIPGSDNSRRNEIIIGLQAVRELETSFPEFSDLLCEIDYDYKSLFGLNMV